jgi:hypothetical protein
MNANLWFRRHQQSRFALLCCVFTFVAWSNCLGQGLINFNNRVTTATPPIDVKFYDITSGTAVPLSGTDQTYRAALLGGPTSATPATASSRGTLSLLASPSTGATWVTFRTGAVAGYVAVGTDGARDSGLPYGSTGIFQVVAWHGTETTWAAAYFDWEHGLIYAGYSNPLTLPVTTGASDLNIPNLVGLGSIEFVNIPEPSIYRLGLAGLILLAIQRACAGGKPLKRLQDLGRFGPSD